MLAFRVETTQEVSGVAIYGFKSRIQHFTRDFSTKPPQAMGVTASLELRQNFLIA